MIRALIARLIGKAPPRPPEPRWSPSDGEALSEAIKSHRPRRTLLQRRMDATHAELAREVWG